MMNDNKTRSIHIKFFRTGLLTTALCLLLQSTSYAAVYRWVDKNGQVNYSDRPVNNKAEEMNIRQNKTTKPRETKAAENDKKAADAETSKQETPEQTGTEQKGKEQQNPEQTGKEQAGTEQAGTEQAGTEKAGKEQAGTESKEVKISKKEKRSLCNEANTDITAISNRGRMRETDIDGESIYLSEKQRQQRLAAAKKKQAKYCR